MSMAKKPSFKYTIVNGLDKRENLDKFTAQEILFDLVTSSKLIVFDVTQNLQDKTIMIVCL